MSIEQSLKMLKAIEDSLELTGDKRASDTVARNRYNLAINMCRSMLPYFKNKDIVEFEYSIVPDEKLQLMWKNIHVFSYDIDNFFLNEGILYLKVHGDLKYRVYFQIDGDSIVILVTYKETDDVVGCGAIKVIDGKFVPEGWLSDDFLPGFEAGHREEGLPTDRNFIADRFLLDALNHLIIVNQYVTVHKDIVVETSKRIPVASNKKRKKHSPKKTKLIRTIKIDTEKAKKIYQRDSEDKREYERHTQQWTRRGHYRKLKDGTMKWIKPQIVTAKGKCKDTINAKKIYKVQ